MLLPDAPPPPQQAHAALRRADGRAPAFRRFLFRHSISRHAQPRPACRRLDIFFAHMFAAADCHAAIAFRHHAFASRYAAAMPAGFEVATLPAATCRRCHLMPA
jgi:hypothetical protein